MIRWSGEPRLPRFSGSPLPRDKALYSGRFREAGQCRKHGEVWNAVIARSIPTDGHLKRRLRVLPENPTPGAPLTLAGSRHRTGFCVRDLPPTTVQASQHRDDESGIHVDRAFQVHGPVAFVARMHGAQGTTPERLWLWVQSPCSCMDKGPSPGALTGGSGDPPFLDRSSSLP